MLATAPAQRPGDCSARPGGHRQSAHARPDDKGRQVCARPVDGRPARLMSTSGRPPDHQAPAWRFQPDCSRRVDRLPCCRPLERLGAASAILLPGRQNLCRETSADGRKNFVLGHTPSWPYGKTALPSSARPTAGRPTSAIAPACAPAHSPTVHATATTTPYQDSCGYSNSKTLATSDACQDAAAMPSIGPENLPKRTTHSKKPGRGKRL